jgi:hypothetical protein
MLSMADVLYLTFCKEFKFMIQMMIFFDLHYLLAVLHQDERLGVHGVACAENHNFSHEFEFLAKSLI